LQLQSISSWDELKEAFRRLWGEKNSWDLLLSEFYAMRRMKDETISNFRRRFASLYYKLPKEVQPPEAAAMLHYVTTFQSDLSFLLMERNSMYFQHMFNNAHEVEDNIQACKELQNQILDEKLKAEKPKTVHNMKKVDHVISFLEGCHEDVFEKNDDKLEEQANLPSFFDTNLAFDPSHDKHGVDYFMYSFIDSLENEFANQLVEDQVDVPRFFLLDDIADIVDFHIYDEYDDDHGVDILEQPVAFSLSKNFPFKQCNEGNKPTYHS
jgi:hypothetical protein